MHHQAEDFVIATGEMHSVREFVVEAFKHVGVTIAWEGEGVDEVGKDAATGTVRVKVDPKYFRPTEVEQLLGDPTKAKNRFGWQPKVAFNSLVQEMMDSDIALMKKRPDA